MGRGDQLWERIAGKTDLQQELFPGQTLVELLGQNRVLIEGHMGVQEYSPERIGVHVRFGTVCICGTGLHLRCMTREQLVISGCIHSVNLIRRGIG